MNFVLIGNRSVYSGDHKISIEKKSFLLGKNGFSDKKLFFLVSKHETIGLGATIANLHRLAV